ncbi:hypothetical protein BV898_19449 [Hypsibius exemplaris]|uniref:Uncharacterized protein n=1 Tax=Hypsibius exemplaris TaxID=2072580 RepID=A0A9X6NKX4_HYPEX|nr:hypothetical protein BV898_19449 [Hypsibius exemplaris]
MPMCYLVLPCSAGFDCVQLRVPRRADQPSAFLAAAEAGGHSISLASFLPGWRLSECFFRLKLGFSLETFLFLASPNGVQVCRMFLQLVALSTSR